MSVNVAGAMQTEPDYRAQDLRVKIKRMMILRVTVITVLLGSLAVLNVYQNHPPTRSIYAVVIATYLLTIAYSIGYRSIRSLYVFAYAQIIGDVLLETGVVYVTGGLDSLFSFIYLFSIFSAGFLLHRRGCLIVASLAGILYGVLVELQYYAVILTSPSRDFTPGELFYNIFLIFFAFYSVAVFASILAERQKVMKEALEEKSTDLLELQRLNESIVRSMADGMVTVDTGGRITAFNKAAEDITGMASTSVRGLHFSEVFNWLGVETFFEDLEFMRKPSYRFELVLPRSDKDLTLGMTVSPLRNESGGFAGLLGIFQDLTPMKEMEEEIKRKDRLAAIGELSAGMAHEIRNPLASLYGSLQVLKGEVDLSDENSRLMDIAIDEMERLNDIVTGFLTFARPKAPAKEGCDLVSIIRDTMDLVVNSKDFNDGIKLKADLPDGPLVIKADPGQIKQVLLNLSLNAIQSVQESGTIGISASMDGSKRAVVCVEDDGKGISKEDIDKVFYPFFSTKEGGAGLGLAIVYRIVEEHGGSIKVESGPGKGARFCVVLPAEEAA